MFTSFESDSDHERATKIYACFARLVCKKNTHQGLVSHRTIRVIDKISISLSIGLDMQKVSVTQLLRTGVVHINIRSQVTSAKYNWSALVVKLSFR